MASPRARVSWSHRPSTRRSTPSRTRWCVVHSASSGERLVIEQCLTGQELSVFCFTDGEHVTPLVPACDYKRVFDGDRGPNTGGMGGYSPPPWWDAAMEQQIRETCIEPVIREMARQGSPFTGVLYGGLMLTDDGPSIIEFNARLGRPGSPAHPPASGERPAGRCRGIAGRNAALGRSALERLRGRRRAHTSRLSRPTRDRQGYRRVGRGRRGMLSSSTRALPLPMAERSSRAAGALWPSWVAWRRRPMPALAPTRQRTR